MILLNTTALKSNVLTYSTIGDSGRVNDMVKPMLAFYDETGLLPTWDLMSNDADVMIGYHAVPVIVDAYLKGLTDVDPEKIFVVVKDSAIQNQFGIDYFREFSYVPSDLEVEAVSKTLEYAFDDAAIAALAKSLGKTGEVEFKVTQDKSHYRILKNNREIMSYSSLGLEFNKTLH